jgi:spore germination protein Q
MYWYYPYANISQAQPPQYLEQAEAAISQRTERNFSEDFLSKNKGKKVTVYLTFEGNNQWNAKKITGILREVGRDYFVLRDQVTGKDNMFLNINMNFVVFDDQPATLGIVNNTKR